MRRTFFKVRPLFYSNFFPGYFRVNYDEENWKLIASYLNSDEHSKIPPLNKAQLLHDAFTFARSGQLSYTVALELTKYLHRETDYIALYPFYSALSFLYTRINGASNYDIFEVKIQENIILSINIFVITGKVGRYLRSSY